MSNVKMSDVKIVQLIPLPNDATYQGAVWGLGSDGVTYEYKRSGWVAIIPNLDNQLNLTSRVTNLEKAFTKCKEIAIREKTFRLEDDTEIGRDELYESLDMLACEIDKLLENTYE